MTTEEAVKRYYNSVFTYIYGKTCSDKIFSNECCNGIFFLFFLKGKDLENDIVYPWLIKTANNKLHEYRRIRKKEERVISLEHLSFVPADRRELCDLIVSDEDIAKAKSEILSRLSPEERELYEAYFEKKMSFIELAQHLGINRNTASHRVAVLRKKLEKEAGKMFTIGSGMIIARVIEALLDR